MERNLILLEPRENSLIVRIFQIVFGIACIAIAAYWTIFNLKSLNTDKKLWITIVLLTGFGLYQILAGMGKTTKYIEIAPDYILVKQNSLLPKKRINASDIEKLELYPLNINFNIKNRKKTTLRFGTNYIEIIESVKNGIIDFAELNKIPVEIKKEEF